jgi:hypothetical protein
MFPLIQLAGIEFDFTEEQIEALREQRCYCGSLKAADGTIHNAIIHIGRYQRFQELPLGNKQPQPVDLNWSIVIGEGEKAVKIEPWEIEAKALLNTLGIKRDLSPLDEARRLLAA